MIAATATTDPGERFRELEAKTRKELDQTREQLTEIELLLQQSSSEAEKLAQRETAITTRIRDMEINLENYSRADIKTLYTTAHDLGLRLFMMRGQVEQLQMRQEQVRERQEYLTLILSLLTSLGVAPALDVPLPSAPARPSTADLAKAASLSRIIEAQEIERQRISRFLHDGTAQTLTNLVLKAEICSHLVDRDAAEAKAELTALRSSLTGSLQETRRLIFNLRPMTLDDIGLVPTLRRYLGEVGRGQGFAHTVQGPETDELPPPVRALLFRLVQDIVSGLATRASLEGVTIDLTPRSGALELILEARPRPAPGPRWRPPASTGPSCSSWPRPRPPDRKVRSSGSHPGRRAMAAR